MTLPSALPFPVLSLLTLILTMGAIALGARVLMRRSAAAMAPYPPRSRRVIAIAGMAGFVAAPLWWSGSPWVFAWEVPPLALRLLAALALAFGTVALKIMARPSPARIRFGLGMVATALAPLLVLLPLFHEVPSGWWPSKLVLLALALVLSAWSLLEMVKSKDLKRSPPPPPAERGLWTFVVVVSGAWAAALTLWPWGGWPTLWPWDAVTMRVIMVIPLTLFMMSWMARNRAELARPAAIGLATWGAWSVMALALGSGDGRPTPWPMVAIAAAFGLFGGWRALKR